MTPHRRNDGQDSDGPLRQAPSRSLRPTDRCREGVPGPGRRIVIKTVQRRQPVKVGSDPAGHPHSHADRTQPFGQHPNPRCRLSSVAMDAGRRLRPAAHRVGFRVNQPVERLPLLVCQTMRGLIGARWLRALPARGSAESATWSSGAECADPSSVHSHEHEHSRRPLPCRR